MPVLEGPDNLVQDIFAFYLEAKSSLKAIDRTPHRVNVSQRLAVRLLLDDGMVVELGRQQPQTQAKQRLERFVEYYPSVLAATNHKPRVVDMRYPNGFVVRTGNAPIN
jgi:cell division protein FtsQ